MARITPNLGLFANDLVDVVDDERGTSALGKEKEGKKMIVKVSKPQT
jgi:hypothetical protein